MVEKLKLRNFMIADLQRVNGELGRRLKEEQVNYEGVCKERNTHSKKLLEMKEQILECANRHKSLVHQIKQLSEEVSLKNNKSLDERRRHKDLEVENEDLEAKAKRLKEELDGQERKIKGHEAEVDKLKVMVANGEEEKKRKRKEEALIMNERDILGLQLVRRQQDIGAAVEEEKIGRFYILNSWDEYTRLRGGRQALEEKLEASRLSHNEKLIEMESLRDLRDEADKLSKETLALGNRNALLEAELRCVVNVHEWRQVEATEPEKFQLILKLQGLQQKNIKQEERLRKLRQEISAKEQAFFQLEQRLKRGVGTEGMKQFELLKMTLRKKQIDLRRMLEALKEAKAEVSDLEIRSEEVNAEIDMHRQNYFKFRTSSGVAREQLGSLQDTEVHDIFRSEDPLLTIHEQSECTEITRS